MPEGGEQGVGSSQTSWSRDSRGAGVVEGLALAIPQQEPHAGVLCARHCAQQPEMLRGSSGAGPLLQGCLSHWQERTYPQRRKIQRRGMWMCHGALRDFSGGGSAPKSGLGDCCRSHLNRAAKDRVVTSQLWVGVTLLSGVGVRLVVTSRLMPQEVLLAHPTILVSRVCLSCPFPSFGHRGPAGASESLNVC